MKSRERQEHDQEDIQVPNQFIDNSSFEAQFPNQRKNNNII